MQKSREHSPIGSMKKTAGFSAVPFSTLIFSLEEGFDISLIKKNLSPKPASIYCDFWDNLQKNSNTCGRIGGFFPQHQLRPPSWSQPVSLCHSETNKSKMTEANTQRKTHKDKQTKTDTQRHTKTKTQRRTHKDKHAKIRPHPPAAFLVALLQILKACLVQQIWLKPHRADQFPLPIKKKYNFDWFWIPTYSR